jgi:hypothetical protein
MPAFRTLIDIRWGTFNEGWPVAKPIPTQNSTTQKSADKHPCLEWDWNPRSRYPRSQCPRLRPRGHSDWHLAESLANFSETALQSALTLNVTIVLSFYWRSCQRIRPCQRSFMTFRNAPVLLRRWLQLPLSKTQNDNPMPAVRALLPSHFKPPTFACHLPDAAKMLQNMPLFNTHGRGD